MSVVLLIMWGYTSTPVTTIPFTNMKACQTAQSRFDKVYGEALVVLRCIDSRTGVVL